MSKVKVEIQDHNLPKSSNSHQELLSDQDEEYDSWQDILYMHLGPYSVEYDHYTKELTITGGVPTEIDCIDDQTEVVSLDFVRTVVFRPSEE